MPDNKEEIKETEKIEEVKEEVPATPEPIMIKVEELIGSTMEVLGVHQDVVEVIDTDKSTRTETVTKKVAVNNFVMGFKRGDDVFPMYIFQRGIDTNIINFTKI